MWHDRLFSRCLVFSLKFLKRGYVGTYHRMSTKHLGRYVTEFAGRHNARPLDTLNQMEQIAQGLVGKRLKYRDLTA